MNLKTQIEAISAKFRELKQSESPEDKRKAIFELRRLAVEANATMDNNQQQSNTKHRRQILDVLQKCSDIEKEIKAGPPVGFSRASRNGQANSLSEEEIRKQAVRSVIFHEVRSSQIKIKPEEYEQIYQRMVKNQEVMKEIEAMVKEQGNDLEKVDAYLDQTYQNALQANKELTEAQEYQVSSRRLKFKLAVSGFFAAIGYKILGLPGLIAGLFAGHSVTA